MTNAQEMLTLLKKFNKGVVSVDIEYGIISVVCKSAKAANGVCHDFLLSRAFKDVKVVDQRDWNKKHPIIVNGIVA